MPGLVLQNLPITKLATVADTGTHGSAKGLLKVGARNVAFRQKSKNLMTSSGGKLVRAGRDVS